MYGHLVNGIAPYLKNGAFVLGLRSSKIEKFLKMSRQEKIEAVRWQLKWAFTAKAVFGAISWKPRGEIPFYLAYYPESLWHDPIIDDLFAKWIRGNQINNNGDGARFISLLLNARKVMEDGIEGDIAELGVWRGNSAALLARVAEQYKRTAYLFDTFEGFDLRDLEGFDQMHQRGQFADTSINYVRETVGCEASVQYIKGFFPESIPKSLNNSKFAIVHIDCDLYDPMKAALDFFHPRMPKGGLLMMHDYRSGCWPGATAAINEFCTTTGEALILLPDKCGTAMIRKSA